ncbi:MAG: flavoprotein [Planctomycetota bacterium]
MSIEPALRERLHRTFDGQHIIVGLSGGIACYKVAEVVSGLAQVGANVTVVMTEAATRFITPLTLQALSGRPVYTNQWQHVESQDPQHIGLAKRAALMIIAPCTMDLMAKLATGRTNDMVCLITSAIDRQETPVLLAPSMNTVMWQQPSNQRNLQTLADDGFDFVGPDEGWQACRAVGPGRMSEPTAILDRAVEVVQFRQGHA